MRRSTLTMIVLASLLSAAARLDAQPYYYQSNAGWCWATSATMIGTYYKAGPGEGANITPNSNFMRPWTVAANFKRSKATGGDQADAAKILTAYTGSLFNAQPISTVAIGDPSVRSALNAALLNGPIWFGFLATANWGHAIVIWASTGGKLTDSVIVSDPSGALFLDPSTGSEATNLRMTWDTFFAVMAAKIKALTPANAPAVTGWVYTGIAAPSSVRSGLATTIDFIPPRSNDPADADLQVFSKDDLVNPVLHLEWDGATHGNGYYLASDIGWWTSLVSNLSGRGRANAPGTNDPAVASTDIITVRPSINGTAASKTGSYSLNLYRIDSSTSRILLKTFSGQIGYSGPAPHLHLPSATTTFKISDYLPVGYDPKNPVTYRLDASAKDGANDTTSIQFTVYSPQPRLAVLAVDCSGSMTTTDPYSNRVVAAQHILNDLLVGKSKASSSAPADLASLVLFTDVVSPVAVNVDTSVCLSKLSQVYANGGTDIAAAIDQARLIIENGAKASGVPLAAGTIFVLTDGDNNNGNQPVIQALARAQNEHITVYSSILTSGDVPSFAASSAGGQARAMMVQNLNGDKPSHRATAVGGYGSNPIDSVDPTLLKAYQATGGSVIAVTSAADLAASVQQIARNGIGSTSAAGVQSMIPNNAYIYRTLANSESDTLFFSAHAGEAVKVGVYSLDFSPTFILEDLVRGQVLGSSSRRTGNWTYGTFIAPADGTFAITVDTLSGRGGKYSVYVDAANVLPSPTIAVQPLNTTAAIGGTLALAVTATGSNLSYQWYRGGSRIGGATLSTYMVANAQAANAGSYYVVVSNSIGSVQSDTITVKVAADQRSTVNLSSRGQVSTGQNSMIVGMVLKRPAQVLFRGVGPTLASLGVSNAASNISLSVVSQATNLVVGGSAAGWTTSVGSSAVAAIGGQVGAFALPYGSQDAATVVNLPAGIYTVLMAPRAAADSGVGLAEAYLVPDSDISEAFANLSTRAVVDVGSNSLIVGFVVKKRATYLLRGVGPTLSRYGVVGPAKSLGIALYAAGVAVPVATNDGWSAAPNAAQIAVSSAAVGAFTLPANSHDSVLLVTLDPGVYTMIVSPSGDNTGNSGVGLAECYLVP